MDGITRTADFVEGVVAEGMDAELGSLVGDEEITDGDDALMFVKRSDCAPFMKPYAPLSLLASAGEQTRLG